MTGGGSSTVKLTSRAPRARTKDGELQIPLPAVEVGIDHGLPQPGATTMQMKVLDQQPSERSVRLVLSAPANTEQTLFLRLNDAKIHLRTEGAQLSSDSSHLRVQFPAGEGYVQKTVTLSW
jgi:hypothetical protein